ncbi:MAG TPA: DUF5677 domain-containing protein [Actinomycetota bacterium]|nr:DUF5677 domain-containing protein [Actinomycetota bacterium]
MAEPDPTNLNELLAMMDEGEKRFVGLLPDDTMTPTYGKLVAGSLLSDCLALHLGIRTLLERWLSDEAGVLLRKMMENTAALVYLGGSRGKLESLAVEFMHALTKKELALWHADKQAYGDDAAEEGLKATQDELQRLKNEWRALGNKGKVPSFPKTDALLRKMRQDDKRGLIVRGHLYAHTSAMGLEGRLNTNREDAAVFETHKDPNLGVSVGATALDLLMGAGLGAAGAMGWSSETSTTIQDLRTDLGERMVPVMRAARKASADR